mgnify:CR=1 FL=1
MSTRASGSPKPGSGLAQYFFTPDYRSVTHSWLGGKTVSIGGIFLPFTRVIPFAMEPRASSRTAGGKQESP